MESKVKTWADVLDALVDAGAFPGSIHRVLIYGPPGTGKSTWALGAFGRDKVERVTLHAQLPPEDLIGSMGLVADNGGTSTVWQDGPAVRAMRAGKVLVLDEVDQHSPETRCALHAILDDKSIAGITLPTGERVQCADTFAIVATTNVRPDELPYALLNRFDLVLLANRPAPGIFAKLPKGMANLLQRAYDREPAYAYTPAVSVRSILALQRLAMAMPIEDAAQLVFGESATDILSSIAVQS